MRGATGAGIVKEIRGNVWTYSGIPVCTHTHIYTYTYSIYIYTQYIYIYLYTCDVCLSQQKGGLKQYIQHGD